MYIPYPAFLAVLLLLILIYFSQHNNTLMLYHQYPVNLNSFPFDIYIINIEHDINRYHNVVSQINNFGLTNYHKWPATDGYSASPEYMYSLGLTHKFSKTKGLAGCACSHIRLWKYIIANNLDWILILEDDVHFHPDFNKIFSYYWNNIPENAEIIYLGHCGCSGSNINLKPILKSPAVCNHAYMISQKGAQSLLNNILPLNGPFDLAIHHYYKHHGGSYIFNGNSSIHFDKPNIYKNQNGDVCLFDGIIYQNRQDFKSIINPN